MAKNEVKYSWYDRGYGGDGPAAVLLEAGMMVAMAAFFGALLGFSHLVGFYDRLRRR